MCKVTLQWHFLLCFFFITYSTSLCPHEAWNLLVEYDVIVVGSGIGGSVTARKLAEKNPLWNILLVERGIPWEQCKSCTDPAAAITAYFDPTTGPLINSVPQVGSLSKKISIKDTMVQGGSSSINILYHTRCDSENYFNTHWPASWNWTGNSGPVKVTQADLGYGGGLVKKALEKIKRIYPNMPVYEKNSLNDEGLHGLGSAPQEFFASQDLRSSAYIAYIKSYNGTNLKSITRVRANKILFNGTTATAVELELVKDGRGYSGTCIIKASRAVIVSSGALGSPKLLKLSGIGPRAELEALGIPVVVANDAVGEHLNDHVTALLICETTTNHLPFTSGYPNAFHSAYWNVDDVPGARPNFYMSMNSERAFEINFGLIETSGMNTNSFGSVKLASADADDAPIVDPGYFANATDKEIFAKAYAKSFLFAQEMGCTPTYNYCTKDSCKTDMERLDKYLAAGHNIPGYHFAGTCGVNRVVDEDSFAVLGTQNLFVVDASVLPYSPPGNPSAIIYMVSERVSDRINEVLRESVPLDSTNGEVTFPPYSYVHGAQQFLKVSKNKPAIYSFQVVAVSSFATPRTTGGDLVKVTVRSSLFVPINTGVKIEDLHNGTYQVEVTISANLVGVVILNIFLNYEPILHGNVNFVVQLE